MKEEHTLINNQPGDRELQEQRQASPAAIDSEIIVPRRFQLNSFECRVDRLPSERSESKRSSKRSEQKVRVSFS